MRSAIIKKARQDEQHNQTTTANINYNENFVQLKKLIDKVQIASDKTETEQNNFHINRKIRDQYIIIIGYN